MQACGKDNVSKYDVADVTFRVKCSQCIERLANKYSLLSQRGPHIKRVSSRDPAL